MITVTFHTQGSRIAAVECKGHAGLAPNGADILCAGVTSAIRLTECTINDVLGLNAAVKVREADAFISLKLPGALGPQAEHTCQNLLTGLMVYLTQLQGEYPDNMIVLDNDMEV